MNDRAAALLEQYDIGVIRTRKGRGAILCDTETGCLIFKEYTGTAERLEAQDKLLRYLEREHSVRAESIVPTKEGELSVRDSDGISYFLKTFCEGRECDINDKEESLKAVEVLANLHEITKDFEDESKNIGISLPEKEYEKRNKELRRVRKFLLQRTRKSDFELSLQNAYGEFLEQALKVTESWDRYRQTGNVGKTKTNVICHGDYKYHNIIRDEKGWFLINFEKCVQDNGIRDLYLFMRKILEKSGWPASLGTDLIESYVRKHPITEAEYVDLYHRLAYPEKFWKIVNFYYNSRKAWIPGKNLEKLDKVMKQENTKMIFLNEVFKGYLNTL